jgi:hypothetical protein
MIVSRQYLKLAKRPSEPGSAGCTSGPTVSCRVDKAGMCLIKTLCRCKTLRLAHLVLATIRTHDATARLDHDCVVIRFARRQSLDRWTMGCDTLVADLFLRADASHLAGAVADMSSRPD